MKDDNNNQAFPVKRAFHHKMKVLTLIDRARGRAHSMVVDNIKPTTIAPILMDNMAREARLMTDEAGHYLHIGREFAAHGVVRQGKDEYIDPTDRTIHTNTIEVYFSVFKRGMTGVYQHCAKRHLHRYLAEYDFRYSNQIVLCVDDEQRADRVLAEVVGRRLMYRDSLVAS
jgi:transposase-like protein